MANPKRLLILCCLVKGEVAFEGSSDELLSQPGKVLTRERLAQSLYGWDEEAESNTLEVHIHHLRKKLFSGLIRTVRGVGYLVEEQS